MDLGNYLINFAAIGLAVSIGIILVLIWLKGKAICTEPRKYILIVEILLMLAVVSLAIYNLSGILWS